MRVLFVAMANSIHTARWVDQLAGQGWDLHLFPSTDSWIEVHPELGNVTLHHTGFRNPARSAKGVRFLRPPEKMGWGEWLSEFADPDGNEFDLKQPVDAGLWKT